MFQLQSIYITYDPFHLCVSCIIKVRVFITVKYNNRNGHQRHTQQEVLISWQQKYTGVINNIDDDCSEPACTIQGPDTEATKQNQVMIKINYTLGFNPMKSEDVCCEVLCLLKE